MPVLQNKPLPSQTKRRSKPLWEGPCSDAPQGGVTFSLLSRYLSCKERFRIHVMEGLRPRDEFNHRLEYGNLWHLCEQYYAPGKLKGRKTHASPDWRDKLNEYAQSLCERYPLSQEQINHWYNVCAVQFPIYQEYWSKHADDGVTRQVLREKTFNVPYKLPSGRVVHLRGKWDGIDVIDNGIYLFEHKTKGDVQEQQIKRQLTFDAQTMLYLIALQEGLCPTCRGLWTPAKAKNLDEKPNQCPNCGGKPLTPYINGSGWKPPQSYPVTEIKGLRYNIVRRPLSGGKHTITRHKSTKSKPGESHEEFYERLGGLIRDNPEHFFIRFRSEVSASDRHKFAHQCLNPVLENLCDDYEWWENCYRCHADVYNDKTRQTLFSKHRQRHFRMPYGIFSSIMEGRTGDLDEYLNNGSTVGLTQCENLFPELT